MAVSQAQLDIIIRAIAEGQGLTQINQQLAQVETGTKGAGGSTNAFTSGLGTLQTALASLGLVVTADQLLQFANNAREAARAETDAINALKVSATGIADYNEALQLGRQATMGMASDQQIAAAEGVLFGAGLATNAQQAAELASAGTVLSNVFASAGASQELFVRLLSSGSPVLYNNFGLTAQMVNAKQQEIEATSNLSGEEAKMQALKEILIEQSNRYKNSLSEETIATAQAAAAKENFSAAFGNLINTLDQTTGATEGLTAALNQMTEGAKSWSWVASTTSDLLEQNRATVESSEAYKNYMTSLTGVRQEAEETATAQEDLTGAIDAAASAYGPAGSGAENLAAQQLQLADAANQAAAAFGEQATAAQRAAQVSLATSNTLAAANTAAGAFGGQQDTFTQKRTLEGYRQATDAGLTYRQEQARQEEQSARESERRIQQTTQAITRSFDQVGTQISSSISGAVSGAINDLTEVWNPGGETDAANGAAQWARRVAAIAAGGIKDEWANPERWANFGGDKSILQPLFDAIGKGDDAAVKVQAQQLLANKTADLFDANMIAQQVEQKLRAQQLQQALNDRVNRLLGERGLQAVTNVTQQVGQAVDVTGQAGQSVGETLSGVTVNAEDAGAKIKASFDKAVPALDTIIQRLKMMAGILQEITQKAGEASGNIQAMNPPGAGAPSDAQNKMGPQTEL